MCLVAEVIYKKGGGKEKISIKIVVTWSWVWWGTSIIPALGRLRQENQEFEGSLYYIARACFKTKQKQA
jgi:hypothetical protein